MPATTRWTTVAVVVAMAVAVALAALTGCEKRTPATTGANAPENAGGMRFLMAIYDKPGNPFWTKVVAGAQEAGKLFGCKVDVQFAGSDAARQNDILEVAVANRVDGIGVVLNFDDAYDAIVAKAREQGIPVIAFNIDDSQRAAGNARMAYIGQNMEDAGYLIAKRLVAEAGLKAGDSVVCPVESPEAVYAVQRYAGVRRALEESGIRSEVLNTGAVSLEDTLNKLTQFLLANKETRAVCAMGGMPMEMAPKASEDAGLGVLPNAGFDLSRQIARNIQEGRTLATVDQQPFYQGLLTVSMLYYNRKYGLLPCDVNTGGAVIDKTNVAGVIDLAETVR